MPLHSSLSFSVCSILPASRARLFQSYPVDLLFGTSDLDVIFGTVYTSYPFIYQVCAITYDMLLLVICTFDVDELEISCLSPGADTVNP